MVGLYSLKSIALAGLALTLSRVSVATDVIEFDIAENIDRRLDSSWNFWSYLMCKSQGKRESLSSIAFTHELIINHLSISRCFSSRIVLRSSDR